MSLNSFFASHGYRTYMCSSDRRYISFVQEENYYINVITLFDERHQTSTLPQMQGYMDIHKQFLSYGRNKDIHFLRLVCTSAEGVSRLMPGADPRDGGLEGREREWIDSVWYLIDTGYGEGRLFIPDNAMEDFYGIKTGLEEYIGHYGIDIAPPEQAAMDSVRTREAIEKAPATEGADGQPRIRMPEKPKEEAAWLTLGLILINVFMYILKTLGIYESDEFALGLDSLRNSSRWFTLVTYMFLHGSLDHLLSNMIMLYAAGGMVERNMNRGLYLLMYFISGLAGGCLSVWQQMMINEEYVSLGASGAIYGVMGGLIALMFLKNRWRSRQFFSRIIIAVMLLFYTGTSREGIDYMCHIGGFVAGFVFTGICTLISYRGEGSLRNERQV